MENSVVLVDRQKKYISAMCVITYKEFFEVIKRSYDNKGGVEGQRAPLTTKTGLRIRKRMISDIAGGTILPPIVIGWIVNQDQFDELQKIDTHERLKELLIAVDPDDLSIIDGIQRTTAIFEALRNGEEIEDNKIRLELWITKNVGNLIYRMLVLNTGQVPWDMKRQLDTIYDPILKEIKKRNTGIKVLEWDKGQRRSQSGDYQSSRLIECFLAFTSRKVHLDIKERVAEDFARMDATEATAHDSFLDRFISCLDIMERFDRILGKDIEKNSEIKGKIKCGKDIFTSAPAAISFMGAAAIHIYGRPGFDRDESKVDKSFSELNGNVLKLIEKLNAYDEEKLRAAIDITTLDEKLSAKSGKVGEFERDFFQKSFTVIFESGDELENLSPCWMAM